MNRGCALLVERREDLRQDLAAVLSSAYSVHTAEGPEAALELLRRGRYELLVWGADCPDWPLEELLQLSASFGGRLVLLTDREPGDRDDGTTPASPAVLVSMVWMPLSVDSDGVLTGAEARRKPWVAGWDGSKASPSVRGWFD